MTKLVKNYLLAILLNLVVWHLIMGNFIYRSPYVRNTNIGKTYKPNTLMVIGTEGFGRNKTNNIGFNSKKVDLKNGEKKIIVLGDSHTEALQINRVKNFVELFENQVKTIIDGVEVVNLGISGNSVAEYLFYADAYKDTFNPEYVIIQVTYNDFTEDALSKSKKNRIIKENDQYKIVQTSYTSQLEKYKYILREHIPLTTNIYNRFKKLYIKDKLDVEIEEHNYEKLIDFELKELKYKYGSNFILLYLPYIPTINSQKTNQKEMEVKNYILKYCKVYNIDILDLEREFINLYEEKNLFPRGFHNTKVGIGHLNEQGHKVVAEKLYKYFIEKTKEVN